MKQWRYLISVAVLTTLLSPVWATEGGVEIRGRVNDHAMVISDGQRRQLHQLLAQHRFASGQFVVVVTLADRGDQDEAGAAEELWQQWQRKDKQNSGMLVLFKAQKSAAIVVGEALKEKLDAAEVQEIINGELAGALQEGDFDSAAMAGIKGMFNELGE